MPRLDAAGDFSRARRRFRAGRIARLLWFACPEPRWPLSLDQTMICPRLPPRRCMVELAAIVGTMEPTRDFDARWRPATNRVEHRWRRIAQAHREGRPLPPVSLAAQADGHYVIDGRHRVSVARALRLTRIEAWVLTLTSLGAADSTSPARATPGVNWY